MKNIHVLPTDKPSRLSIIDSQLIYSKEYFINAQNIYITSDEEIKEGWHFNNEIGVNKPVYVKDEDVEPLKKIYGNPNHLQKIILTTDSDLIKDGVQAIDDEFLEWFVENPSCESVEVKKETYAEYKKNSYNDSYLYEIIIPKEEAKIDLEKEMFELEQELDIPSHLRWHNSKPKQETLEEVLGSSMCQFSVIENKLAILYRNQVKIYDAITKEQDKKCFHPLPYRLAKSDVNYECTLCGKFI